MVEERRPLTEDEAELTKKNLVRAKEELEHSKVLIDCLNFDIETRIDFNAKQQKKTNKANLIQVKHEMEQIVFAISTATEQLEKGVVVKEDKDVDAEEVREAEAQ